MRRTPWLRAESCRVADPLGSGARYGDSFGAFVILGPNNQLLRVIVSDGDYKAAGLPEEYAWEHVSVSLANRCPNWAEMSFIKEIFWRDDETVMQLHVPKVDHKNFHPYTLHLWKPLKAEISRPPSDTVAV